MKKFKKSKTLGVLLMALAIVGTMSTRASAHCDTMDGPTAADGIKAMETNNINLVQKWVMPEYEKELSQIFYLSMKVKDLSPEAKEISEKYFLENLIRIHRAGENAPFTGLKPSGTPVDERVLAADKSIEVGNLSPLEKLIEKDKMHELEEKFRKVMALKNFDVNDVEAGREYIEAYVQFFHLAEGEEGHEVEDGHAVEHSNTEEVKESHDEAEALPIIPWTLAGVFFTSTIILAVVHHKSHSK